MKDEVPVEATHGKEFDRSSVWEATATVEEWCLK